jgi:hypothetical protein
MQFSAEQLRVATNITAIAYKWRGAGMCNVPALVHLAVTKQESEWHEDAHNAQDPQGSYGIYQINQEAHPDSAELAQSPWADYAFYLVFQEWNAAWELIKTPWALDQDRGRLIEIFAPAAQGSIDWPPGTGEQRYQEALAMLELIG